MKERGAMEKNKRDTKHAARRKERATQNDGKETKGRGS